jgi:hypothetical protein
MSLIHCVTTVHMSLTHCVTMSLTHCVTTYVTNPLCNYVTVAFLLFFFFVVTCGCYEARNRLGTVRPVQILQVGVSITPFQT